MNTDNVNEPLKSTLNTSYARIFALCVFVGPLWVIGMTWLARQVLIPEDIEWVRGTLSLIVSFMTVGSGAATLKGGLDRTKGKIAAQVASIVGAVAAQVPQVPENVTAGGDVNMQTVPSTPMLAAELPPVPTPLAVYDFDALENQDPELYAYQNSSEPLPMREVTL